MRHQHTIQFVHRLSASLLAAFLFAHIANHLAALHSVEAHQEFMAVARRVYRATFFEPFLLAAVVIQSVTGLLQLRAGWGKRRDFWSRLQALSGGYLLFFLIGHVIGVLAIRYADLDSDFYAAAVLLTTPPLPIFYVPYYSLGVIAAFAHLACALHFRRERIGKSGDLIAGGILAAGVVFAVVIVAAFSGAFYDIQVPHAYRDAIARFF
jgi:succinate dehydrogenase/fumarate reductase cytochrome b subunit